VSVYHCNGDFYSAEGYTPERTTLTPGGTLRFAPTGGRPCDGAFPYFRVKFADSGLTLAVGWPAQWAADFRAVDNGVQISAGQEKTHLRLMPGESIRTPRMTLLAWCGEEERGVNMWRRWYLRHILPNADGAALKPHLACAATEGGEEFTNASEENQIRLMEKFKKAGFDFDVWWIDAGWYPCRDEESGAKIWWHTGTWKPDPDRFPNGFAPVAKRVKELEADLLVWFEPERVYSGSELDREHPEWLLKTKPKAEGSPDMNRLLDLGQADCRKWLTEHVCKLIADNGIRIYRQDFNFPPLDYWRDNDSEDRQGMHENLHVQGYLQYWDDLLMRNPGLWIDSCSSGGRRNDLETMRRSVPLHYTDFGYGNHAVKLAFHHTLYEWIPYFKDFSLSWDVVQPGEDMRFDKQIDSFSFHCGMAAMLFATADIRREDYDFALGEKMIAIWRKAVDTLLHGDYYPLTPYSKSPAEWVVWQFDRPETGKGLVQGIRLQESKEERKIVWLKGIQPDLRYLFENPETGGKCEVAGKELIQSGFVFNLPMRSGAIWFYSCK
jgi:alpha-galactosidase